MANGFPVFEIVDSNTITTTDATATRILTAQMVPNSTANLELRIVARNAGNGDSKCWARAVPLKRGASGSATVLGAQGDLLPTSADSGASSWTISLTTLGDQISMNVIGQNGQTIHWYATVTGEVVA